MYTQEVLKHFRSPHNYGKIDKADGVGKVGNLTCGDVMWLYIKVSKNKKGQEIIKDIKFETFGCTAAIATSSVITDLAKSQTINKALKITKDEIVKSLGELPPVKVHCSVLAVDALAEAIYDYLERKKRKIPEFLNGVHQRIQKERNVVESKYEAWTRQEEKMHNEGK